jgi:hypothetical protein
MVCWGMPGSQRQHVGEGLRHHAVDLAAFVKEGKDKCPNPRGVRTNVRAS